jgi:hypothetical protein
MLKAARPADTLEALIFARNSPSVAGSAPAVKPSPRVASVATSVIDSHRRFPSMSGISAHRPDSLTTPRGSLDPTEDLNRDPRARRSGERRPMHFRCWRLTWRSRASRGWRARSAPRRPCSLPRRLRPPALLDLVRRHRFHRAPSVRSNYQSHQSLARTHRCRQGSCSGFGNNPLLPRVSCGRRVLSS